jgi:hypothetical protein
MPPLTSKEAGLLARPHKRALMPFYGSLNFGAIGTVIRYVPLEEANRKLSYLPGPGAE